MLRSIMITKSSQGPFLSCEQTAFDSRHETSLPQNLNRETLTQNPKALNPEALNPKALNPKSLNPKHESSLHFLIRSSAAPPTRLAAFSRFGIAVSSTRRVDVGIKCRV